MAGSQTGPLPRGENGLNQRCKEGRHGVLTWTMIHLVSSGLIAPWNHFALECIMNERR